MAIEATCESCQRLWSVKDQHAGRRIKCPHCGAAIQIPGGMEDTVGDDDFEFLEEPASRPTVRQTGTNAGAGTSSFPVVGLLIGIALLLLFMAGVAVTAWFVFFRDDKPDNLASNDDPVTPAVVDPVDDPDPETVPVPDPSDTDDPVEPVVMIPEDPTPPAPGPMPVDPPPDVPDDPAPPDPGLRVETGELSADDETLEGGEYCDRIKVVANAGTLVIVDMYSDEFDPYLIIKDEATSFQLDNDDFRDDTSRSQVMLVAPKSAAYTVMPTSFDVGATGSYRISIQTVAPDPADAVNTREESGALESTDRTLQTGEYVDAYKIVANEGDVFVFDLYSDEFDPYLFATSISVDEFQLDNDDFNGELNHARITMRAPAAGTYEVNVTTFEPNESGAYRLVISEF